MFLKLQAFGFFFSTIIAVMSILNNDYTGIFETYLGIALFIAVFYGVVYIFWELYT